MEIEAKQVKKKKYVCPRRLNNHLKNYSSVLKAGPGAFLGGVLQSKHIMQLLRGKSH